MEFKEVRNTEVYGAPRDVTVYALNKDEENILVQFEEGKQNFRKKEGMNEPDWEALRKFADITAPIVKPFIAGLIDGVMYFERYGVDTNFGNGFRVLVPPILISNTSFPIETAPEFFFRHLTDQHELYCWPTLQGIKSDQNNYLTQAKEVYHEIQINQDGLKIPKLSRAGVMSINAAYLMPQFLGSLRRIYQELGLKKLSLLEQLTKAEYDESRFGKRQIVLEAITEKRQRIIMGVFPK